MAKKTRFFMFACALNAVLAGAIFAGGDAPHKRSLSPDSDGSCKLNCQRQRIYMPESPNSPVAALFEAINRGRPDYVAICLENEDIDLGTCLMYYATPLVHAVVTACDEGTPESLEVVRLLSRDPRAGLNDSSVGRLPLRTAVQRGCLPVAMGLLKCGADPNVGVEPPILYEALECPPDVIVPMVRSLLLRGAAQPDDFLRITREQLVARASTEARLLWAPAPPPPAAPQAHAPIPFALSSDDEGEESSMDDDSSVDSDEEFEQRLEQEFQAARRARNEDLGCFVQVYERLTSLLRHREFDAFSGGALRARWQGRGGPAGRLPKELVREIGAFLLPPRDKDQDGHGGAPGAAPGPDPDVLPSP